MRVVFCTCPQESSEIIADTVLKDRLVACVNILPAVKSKYWWEGKLESDDESLLIMKTEPDLVTELIDRIRDIHPYHVPEVISLEIKEGNPEYLKWIHEETR